MWIEQYIQYNLIVIIRLELTWDDRMNRIIIFVRTAAMHSTWQPGRYRPHTRLLVIGSSVIGYASHRRSSTSSVAVWTPYGAGPGFGWECGVVFQGGNPVVPGETPPFFMVTMGTADVGHPQGPWRFFPGMTYGSAPKAGSWTAAEEFRGDPSGEFQAIQRVPQQGIENCRFEWDFVTGYTVIICKNGKYEYEYPLINSDE